MAQQTCNQFEPTTNTSSATICKWCGQEKFLHALKVDYMANQTAVQWLLEIFWGNEGMLTTKQLEQAKQMEKEQIKEAYCKGDDNIGAEQYYKETYGKSDNL